MNVLELANHAQEAGIKLEMMNGLPLWEAFPSYRHQVIIDDIRASLPSRKDKLTRSGCACIHVADVYILFPDGSLKRPDVAIFCREPPLEEQETAITLIPEAVIEVVSKGYEAKDMQFGPVFYLSHGVKDVIVMDPATNKVIHTQKEGEKIYLSPVNLRLKCGCNVTV